MTLEWPLQGIRILHVDDSPDDQLRVRETVREYLGGGEVVTAKLLSEAVAALESARFDVVLLDLGLPDGDGLDVIRRVATVPPAAPIVVLGGNISLAMAIQVISAGAQDFVNKDEIDKPGILARAVRYAIERHAMLRDLERRARDLAENLVAHEASFRKLIEESRDGVLALGLDRTVLYANPAARRLLGAGPDGPLRWPLDFPPAERAEVALGAGEPVPVAAEAECWRTTWEGAEAWVVTLRDVTDRKRAERALEEKDGQLVQVQKMAVLGNLASGVAHDFNNLLGMIGGYAGLVEKALPPGSPLRDDILEVQEATRRAAALTRQILAFSRREDAKPVVLDINQVVTDMQKLLARTISKDIELTVKLAPDLWRVRANPSRIEQLILNLAVNARDAMHQGGSLRMETRNVAVEEGQAGQAVGLQSGRYILVEVADTGTGMSKDVLRRLFDPFFTTKPKDKGTGLGLAMVYGIVKQAGGRIHVDSEVGVGSTFKVYLPATDEETCRSTRSEQAPELRGTGQTA